MWEVVEASTRKIGVGKTKGRRSKGGKRREEREKGKEGKSEEGEDSKS